MASESSQAPRCPATATIHVTRIFFDALSLDGRPSGTRTRLIRLVPALVERGFDVTVAHGANLDAEARRALNQAHLLQLRHPPPRNPLARSLLQPSLYRRFQSRERPDVVCAETWPMPNCPGLIPVIYDLRYLQLRYHLRLAFTRMLERAARRAVRLHVPTEAVRHELISTGLVMPEKVDVIPMIVTVPASTRPSQTGQPHARPFVLVVGHAEQRKDYELVRAVARLIHDQGAEVLTVGRSLAEGASTGYRAGRPTKVDDVSGSLSAPTPIRNLGIVTDEELSGLYSSARAVLAPSRYEGFGLVPLEALAAGAWVVASDIPPHHEVLGEAAGYFEPGDARKAVALLRPALVAGQGEREHRAELGRRRARRFNASRAVDCFVRSLEAAARAVDGPTGN
jgi:glycosyltransferase involved in cell wall biosynthesis